MKKENPNIYFTGDAKRFKSACDPCLRSGNCLAEEKTLFDSKHKIVKEIIIVCTSQLKEIPIGPI